MLHSYLLASIFLLTISQTLGYSSSQHGHRRPDHSPSLASFSGKIDATESSSRRQWISQVVASTFVASSFLPTEAAVAEDDAPAASTYSIEKCSTSGKAPCVSTSNVRNLDLYLPPWTFDRSPDEVMSRLKGSVVADSSCQIVQQDGNQYLKVEAKRTDLFSTIDELEFAINPTDQVVTFRSLASNDSPDFGINKKRLEEIRKRAGIFGVMGEYMNSADSASSSERGYGPLGQLKAFYGLQSGGGFEDVVLE